MPSQSWIVWSLDTM